MALRLLPIQAGFLAALLALAVAIGFSLPANAVTFDAGDHPNGALADPTYGLRLGTNATFPNTFTFAPGVVFEFDASSPNEATLTGTIQHNRDSTGPLVGAGLYGINATFVNPLFTDPDAANWHDPEPNNQVYNGMLDDLFNNSDDTPSNNENMILTADRIYWELIDMELTFLIQVGNVNTYTGPTQWDEFPNANKEGFIQLNHRINAGQPDVLVFTGWLEEFEDAGRERTSDFLYTLTPRPVPEPSSLLLLGTGLLAFGFLARRYKKKLPERRT